MLDGIFIINLVYPAPEPVVFTNVFMVQLAHVSRQATLISKALHVFIEEAHPGLSSTSEY